MILRILATVLGTVSLVHANGPPALPYSAYAAAGSLHSSQRGTYHPSNPPSFPGNYEQTSPLSKVSLQDLTKLDTFNAFDITRTSKYPKTQPTVAYLNAPPAVPHGRPPAVPEGDGDEPVIPRISNSAPLDRVSLPAPPSPVKQISVNPITDAEVRLVYKNPPQQAAANRVAPKGAQRPEPVHYVYPNPYQYYNAPSYNAQNYNAQNYNKQNYNGQNYNAQSYYNPGLLQPAAAPAAPPSPAIAALPARLPLVSSLPVAPAISGLPVAPLVATAPVQPAFVRYETPQPVNIGSVYTPYNPPEPPKGDTTDYIAEYDNVAAISPSNHNLVPLYPPDLMAEIEPAKVKVQPSDPIHKYKVPNIFHSVPAPPPPEVLPASMTQDKKVILPLATSITMPRPPQDLTAPAAPPPSPPPVLKSHLEPQSESSSSMTSEESTEDHTIVFEEQNESAENDESDDILDTDDILREIENYTFDLDKDADEEKVSLDVSDYDITGVDDMSLEYVHSIDHSLSFPQIDVQNSAPFLPSLTTENNAPYARQPPREKPQVDCIMNPWTPWSDCSRSCGGGIQYRHRSIRLQAANGGLKCSKSYAERTCNFKQCPVVDCEMNPWTPWSACSRSCDGGVQSRSRTIRQPPTVGGKECPISYGEERCGLRQCSSDCETSQWESWGSCSVPCGQGVRKRARYVTLQKKGEGEECPMLQEESSCFVPCPVDCLVSSWGEWSECTRSCAAGRRIRSRFIMQESRRGGQTCPTDLEQSETCNLHSCPWNMSSRSHTDFGVETPEVSALAPTYDRVGNHSADTSVLSFLKETLQNNPSLMDILNNGGHISPTSDSRVPVIIQKPIILEAPSSSGPSLTIGDLGKDLDGVSGDGGHLPLPRRIPSSIFENKSGAKGNQGRRSRSRSVRINRAEDRSSRIGDKANKNIITGTRTVPFQTDAIEVPNPPKSVRSAPPIADAPCKTLYCKRKLGLIGNQLGQTRPAATRGGLSSRILSSARARTTRNQELLTNNRRRINVQNQRRGLLRST